MNLSASTHKFESLRRFFEADPDNARLRRDCVDAAVAAGEFGFVRELADKRLASVPADPEAQFDRATALIGLKDFAGALEALRPLDATIPGVRFNTGLCFYMLGQYAEARPYFQAGYDAGERSAGGTCCYVRTLHYLGEIETGYAIVKANQPLVLSDPAFSGAAALLAVDSGDAPAAMRYAQASLAANPDQPDALVTAGMLHSLELDTHQARCAFQRVVDLNPMNGRAWVGLGTLSMASRDFPSAVRELERGLETMSTHIGSWHVLGWAHLFGGDLDRAEAVFARALEMNRNFAESHGSLAVVAAMRGDRERAQRLIEIAERLDRNGMAAKYAETLLAAPAEQNEMLIRLVEKVPVQGPRFAEFMRQAHARKPPGT